MTPEQIIAQYVETDPILANERDLLMVAFKDAGGRWLGPQGAAELMYKIGRLLNQPNKPKGCLNRDGAGTWPARRKNTNL